MSSYQGVNFSTTCDRLNKVFKENITTYNLDAEDDKVQVEYAFNFKNDHGQMVEAYLYLWKEYSTIWEDCHYDFHIGADSVSESHDLFNYLISKL